MRAGLKLSSLGKRRAEFTPEGDDESYKQPRTDLTVSQAPTNWVCAPGLISVTWHSADTHQSPVNPDTRLYGDYTNPTMWRPEIAQHPHGQPYTEGAGPEWVQYPYVDQFGSVADAQLQNSFQGLTLPKNTSHPQHLCQYQQAVRQEDGSEYIGQTNYPKYACYYVAEADVGLFPPGTIVRTYGTDLPYCKSSASGLPCPEESSAAKHVTPALILDRRRTDICGVWIEGRCLGTDQVSRQVFRSSWRPTYRSLRTQGRCGESESPR